MDEESKCIPVDLSDDEMIKLQKLAKRYDLKLNKLVTQILIRYINME